MYYSKPRPFDGNAVVPGKKISSYLIVLVDCFVIYAVAFDHLSAVPQTF
jgi:hypothetical protein